MVYVAHLIIFFIKIIHLIMFRASQAIGCDYVQEINVLNLFPKQECQADILMLTVRILCRDLAPSGSKKYPCRTYTYVD